MEWHIIGILAAVVIYNLYRYYHDNDNYEYCPVVTDTSVNNQITETMEETISTRQLALRTIENIVGVSPNKQKKGVSSLNIKASVF